MTGASGAVTAAELLAEARAWIGTPFHWQASLKGVGCDCKGYPWGVARELGLPEAGSFYAAICDYGYRVPIPLLQRGLAETLARVGEPRPGDLLLLSMGGKAQHLGFHGGDVLLHTYTGRAVTPTPLKAALRHWPLHSAWRFASVREG